MRRTKNTQAQVIAYLGAIWMQFPEVSLAELFRETTLDQELSQLTDQRVVELLTEYAQKHAPHYG